MSTRVLNFYVKYDTGYILARMPAIISGFIPVLREMNFPIFKKTEDCVVLNEYQTIVMDNVLQNRINRERNMMGCSVCLLQMNTGLGKTRMGVAMVEKLLVKTLIIVPTKHIANQWIEEISDLFTTSIYENKLDDTSADIILCIMNTARNKDVDFFNKFTFVILDEVHEFTSNCNKKILEKTGTSPYVLGLTATPDKGDNLLKYVEAYLDKTLYTSDIVDIEKISHKWNAHAKIIKYRCHPKYAIPVLNPNGDICSMSTTNRIIEDAERLNVVVEEIQKLYNFHDSKFAQVANLRDKNNTLLHKYSIYVFAETRDMLTDIKNKLIESTISSDDVAIEDELSILKGGIKNEEIKDAESRRIILTTYGYSRRGVSYSNFTALVFATSRNAKYSIEQVLGRIFRLRGPKDVVRFIVYIWDSNTIFKKHVKNHIEIYEKFGYTYSIKE
jgi:superfamily II DNA or RNA helicase